MTRTRAWSQNFVRLACLFPGRMRSLVSFCTRMPLALWMVRPLTVCVDIFFACALEDATTISVGSALDTGGQINSTAGKTSFCTTCVFPDPPWPSSRRWCMRRRLGALPSSSQTLSQHFANCTMKRDWSRVNCSSAGRLAISDAIYALGELKTFWSAKHAGCAGRAGVSAPVSPTFTTSSSSSAWLACKRASCIPSISMSSDSSAAAMRA